MMIKKSKDFREYKKEIEYEDGECWDLLGYKNNISFNSIIAQGKDFIKSIKIEDDWITISDNTVIKQDDSKTIMQDKCYTTYHSRYDSNNLELDCIQYITIKHNKSLSQIKEDYKRENNLFKTLKSILLNRGYKDDTYRCFKCNECYNCISKKKLETEYQKFNMIINFNDNQTIGEAKAILNKDYDEIKALSNQFFNAETDMCLDFTKKGAIGEIRLKHYYK